MAVLIPSRLADDFWNYVSAYVKLYETNKERFSVFWDEKKNILKEDDIEETIETVEEYFECDKCGFQTSDDEEMIEHVFEEHFRLEYEKEGLL